MEVLTKPEHLVVFYDCFIWQGKLWGGEKTAVPVKTLRGPAVGLRCPVNTVSCLFTFRYVDFELRLCECQNCETSFKSEKVNLS